MPSAKSKKKSAEPVSVSAVETIPEIVIGKTESTKALQEEPKKRGKKQPKIVAVVTPNGIEGSFLPEPRKPLIARLQISSSDIQFTDTPLFYDPNPPGQPEPYDSTKDSFFTEQNQEVITEEVPVATIQQVAHVNKEPVKQDQKESIGLDAFTKCDLMMEYRECREAKKIPETTNIACFWCAHTFDWRPCVIPEREEKGVYRIYGNFCSPSCGLAFLLSETLDTHVRWERIALLHRLYGGNYKSHRIFPAPARETLKLFGGPASIDQFRGTIQQEKVRIDMQVPPMVSILGSIDTKPIDFYDSSMKHTISPLLGELVPKAEEGLRLKRSRPLKEKDSTLDSVLKIQIKGRG
jgi:hypothetical protein